MFFNHKNTLLIFNIIQKSLKLNKAHSEKKIKKSLKNDRLRKKVDLLIWYNDEII